MWENFFFQYWCIEPYVGGHAKHWKHKANSDMPSSTPSWMRNSYGDSVNVMLSYNRDVFGILQEWRVWPSPPPSSTPPCGLITGSLEMVIPELILDT